MFRAVIASLIVLLANVVGEVEAALPKWPNIVLIMADDLGIECLGCYGGTDYATPELDRLAKTGLRFTHAYSQPLCTPTRLQIMTGKYNHRNWLSFGILPKGEKTFGHMMGQFGYRTCIAGKWQLASYDPPEFPNAKQRRGTGTHPKDAGFDEYSLFHSEETEDKGSRYANPTFLRNGKLHKAVDGAYGEDLTVDYILDYLGKAKDKPAFVYYPMALPHSPHVPTPHSKIWKDPKHRLDDDVKYFKDMVEYTDVVVGRLIKGIDKLGLRDNTIVMFYSDNGTNRLMTSHMGERAIRGGKGDETQNGIRVPLIVNWPGAIKPSVSRDLIDATDFLPTLAELAGLDVPADWKAEGVSFAPQIFGKAGHPRESVFFWYDPRPGWNKERFHRHIFALDHNYKLFTDGRLFDIRGKAFREVELDLKNLSPQAKAAKDKLRSKINTMMKPPFSSRVGREVDTYGRPVTKK